MLKLDDYPIFQKDIQSNVVNIHPVVVINSNPVIYLSQNEEILNIGTELVDVPGFVANNILGSTTYAPNVYNPNTGQTKILFDDINDTTFQHGISTNTNSIFNVFEDYSMLPTDVEGAAVGIWLIVGTEIIEIIEHAVVGNGSIASFSCNRVMLGTEAHTYTEPATTYFFDGQPPQEIVDYLLSNGEIESFLQDAEVLQPTNPTLFKANNLKVPSIKESIDLESRNIKINNITLTFSNQDGFSDLFATQNFLNKYVDIYWKSQSATALEECLPIYKAVIKRVDHDYKNVKLILEDLTQSVLHKEVPTAVIPAGNAYNEKDINKLIPFVYGNVDKAPCVLWKNASEDTSIERNIYVTPDRHDMPISHSTYSEHYRNDLDNNSDNTILSIFSGTYLNVLNNYHYHTNSESSTAYTEQAQVVQDDISKIKLVQKFNAELPSNSVADNIVQVVQRRIGSSWSLIDFTGTENNVLYNYLGEADGKFISRPELAISRDDNLYLQYSIIPDNSLSNLSDIETDNNLITLDSFRTGNDLGNYPDDDSALERWQWHPYSSSGSWQNQILFDMNVSWNGGWGNNSSPSHDSDQAFEDSYSKCVRRTMYDLQSHHEIVALPDAKRLYTLLDLWYVGDIDHLGYYDGFRWGTPIDFDLGDEVIGYSQYWQWAQEGEYYPGGLGLVDAIFPRYMCRLERVDGTFIYVTFQKDHEGNIQDGYNLNSIPEGSISVEFWDLMESQGWYHTTPPEEEGVSFGGQQGVTDIPRYRINYLMAREVDEYHHNMTQHWKDYEYFLDSYRPNYNVGWNGVSPGVYGNTFESALPNEWKAYHTSMDYLNNNWLSDSHPDWNSFFSQSQWHVLFLEDETFGNIEVPGASSSVIAKKGTMMPTTQLNRIWSSSNDGSPYADGFKLTGQTMYPGSPIVESPEYLSLQYGGGISENRKLGILFTLADSDAEDVIYGSGLTYFYGKVGFTTDSYGVSTHRLALKFLEANVEPDSPLSDSLESDGVGTLTHSLLSNIDLDSSNFYETRTAITDDSDLTGIPVSYEWDMPGEFNSGILRFEVEPINAGSNVVTAQNIQALIYNLGVKHIMEIENALDKTFYINTLGRNHDNTNFNTPTSIIKHIIENELDISLSQLIDASYGDIDGLVAGAYEIAFSQSKKINSKKLIEEIAKSSPIVPIFKSNSQLSFAMIKNSYGDSNITIKSKDVINSSFTRTKIEDVKTIVRVKYKKDYARDEYEKATKYTDAYDFYGNGDSSESTYENGYKKDYYGLNPTNPGDSVLEVENDYIRDENTAKNLRDFLLAYHCQQHNIIKCRLPLTYVNIEIADIVEFDSLINGMKCYGEDYTQNYIKNGQGVFKYFMVTSVNKSIKSIDIECIQMHDLGRTPGVIVQGSGDVNRDGVVNPSDTIILANHTTYGLEYFTEGQHANADMNFDGVLDESDISLISELMASGG